MDIALHLVSMPWSDPQFPSIQTAALKAYINERLGSRVSVSTYSPFLEVPAILGGERFAEAFSSHSRYGELSFLDLVLRRFGGASAAGRSLRRAHARFKRVNGLNRVLKKDMLDNLERATRSYLDERLAPSLSPGRLNVIGFTLNYNQTYASAYAIRHLLETQPSHRMLFLFGGMGAVMPEYKSMLEKLDVPGLCVAGEGELKLEKIVRLLLDAEADDVALLREQIARSVKGVFQVSDPVNLYVRNEEFYRDQIRSVDALPEPDHREYFAALDHICGTNHDLRVRYTQTAFLLAEGSRGCFAKCDFCGINYLWEGFRKADKTNVLPRVESLIERYGVPAIMFTDNVCDTWADQYAEELVERRARIRSFMELRAHHPETFWTKLALSGVEGIQIGTEAISESLLKRINKGTKAYQNVIVQKYLDELGVSSFSNLITHHPRSTVEDVEETKRILCQITHLTPYSLSPFRLTLGSPLYADSEKDARVMRPYNDFTVTEGFESCPLDFGYFVPPSLALAPEIAAAWDEFARWLDALNARIKEEEPVLMQTRVGRDRLQILDTRSKRTREHRLDGDWARVYTLCHRGGSRESLLIEADLAPGRVDEIVGHLVDDGLLLELSGHCIALATRPRDELVANYFRSRAQPRQDAIVTKPRAALRVLGNGSSAPQAGIRCESL